MPASSWPSVSGSSHLQANTSAALPTLLLAGAYSSTARTPPVHPAWDACAAGHPTISPPCCQCIASLLVLQEQTTAALLASLFTQSICTLLLTTTLLPVPSSLPPPFQPSLQSSLAIKLDREKCIKCMRCVTTCSEVQGMNVLGAFSRGRERHIGFLYGERQAAGGLVVGAGMRQTGPPACSVGESGAAACRRC